MPTVRYPLRTPASYLLLMATLIGLAIWLVLLTSRVRWDRSIGMLVVFAAAAPLLALLLTAPYRAWPGGHIAFTDAALVVQRGRRPVRFARGARLMVRVQQVELRVTAALIPIGTFDRGQVISLTGADGATARFSTLLAPHDQRAALVADLARFAHGGAAIGPQPTAPRPRTPDDERLDAELRDAD